MSAERMTSREDYDVLKSGIDDLIRDFVRMGFDKGQIGSAMAGISLALVKVHVSRHVALAMIEHLGSAFESDGALKQ